MGITERREREKNERRQAILNCAKELILLNGIEHVSMEDIARKAELSKATLYLYFSNKEILFSEICEESARVFLDRFKQCQGAAKTGLEAMKYFWRGFVEQFGGSDEIFIVFQVHNFLDTWIPILSSKGRYKAPQVDAIIETMGGLINQCKDDGIFDPGLDSAMTSSLLLSMFSTIVEKAARLPPEIRKSPAIIEEMTNAFQIMIRGFAKEGVPRRQLDFMTG